MPPIRVTLKLADEDVGHLTALMEQAIKSAARGFRSFENYRIRILFYCGKLKLFPVSTH